MDHDGVVNGPGPLPTSDAGAPSDWLEIPAWVNSPARGPQGVRPGVHHFREVERIENGSGPGPSRPRYSGPRLPRVVTLLMACGVLAAFIVGFMGSNLVGLDHGVLSPVANSASLLILSASVWVWVLRVIDRHIQSAVDRGARRLEYARRSVAELVRSLVRDLSACRKWGSLIVALISPRQTGPTRTADPPDPLTAAGLTSSIQRTGPPARTWASPSQVLPVLAA